MNIFKIYNLSSFDEKLSFLSKFVNGHFQIVNLSCTIFLILIKITFIGIKILTSIKSQLYVNLRWNEKNLHPSTNRSCLVGIKPFIHQF